MKAKLTWLCSALLALALVSAGCSDDDKPPTADMDSGKSQLDGKTTPPDEGTGYPDGYKLWDCKTPGSTCNAHDPCAINAICGQDLKCHPAKFQNCDDGLPCTTDTCAGLGVCKNEPVSGKCALAVRVPTGTTCAQVTGGKVKFDAGVAADSGVSSDGSAKDASTAVDLSTSTGDKETIFCCFKKGDRNPADQCSECNPDSGDDATVGGNSKKWSPANGGSCDDANLCTKNDYCQYGICKGTSFSSQCSDGYGCTEDLCDGKGGCLGNKMKAGWCLVNATCYKDGTMNPSGACSTCDSKKNNAYWTTVTSTCTIKGKCYKAGDKDTTGCNICDPKVSTTAWSPIAGLCSIGGKCYKPGDKHTLGCAECDPTTSQVAWTVKTTTDCLIADKCYKAKVTDTTGCKECNPATDKYNWSAVSGLCAIDGKCYKPKDKHTGLCAECDPTVSQTKWTVKTTTDCLIGNTCYKALAKDTTGCKECAPATTKYDWSSVANTCLIGGKCYAKNIQNTGGCATCLPGTNAKGWTVTGSDCLINDTCYKPKIKDSTGCGECIPAYDKYNWSVTKAGSCLISGSCVTSGTTDSSGCATCDPTKSKTAWTPSGNKCLILGDCVAAKKLDSSSCLQCKVTQSKTTWTPVSTGATTTVFDFETGNTKGWNIKNSVANYGWTVTTNRKYEGKYALYYGNPTTKNYASSVKNDGVATSPAISLTSSKKAGVHLRIYMDVESSTSYDKFLIYAGTTKVWEKGVNSSTMKKWINVYLDLSKYSGTSIKLKFDFDSYDTVSNSTEGIYVDAVVVYEGC